MVSVLRLLALGYTRHSNWIIPDDHLQEDEEQDRSVPGSLPADDNLPFPLLLSE